MKNQIKKFSICFYVVCVSAFLSNPAWAIKLTFNPSDPVIGMGDSVDVDIVISGLEDENLSGFDLTINYDDTILDFDSYVLGSELGDIGSGEAMDWSVGDNLVEISWLWDFSFQSDEFTLATLTFLGESEGESALSFSNVVLSDDSWPAGQLGATYCGGNVSVTTPAPPTLFLLSSGLFGFVGFRKKIQQILGDSHQKGDCQEVKS